MQIRLQSKTSARIASDSMLNYGGSPEIELYWTSATNNSRALLYFELDRLPSILGEFLYQRMLDELISNPLSEAKIGLKLLEQENFNTYPPTKFICYAIAEHWRAGQGLGAINDDYPVNWEYRLPGVPWRYFVSGPINVPMPGSIDLRTYPGTVINIINGVLTYPGPSSEPPLEYDLPPTYLTSVTTENTIQFYQYSCSINKETELTILFKHGSSVVISTGSGPSEIAYPEDKILKILPSISQLQILNKDTLVLEEAFLYADVQEIKFAYGCNVFPGKRPIYGDWPFSSSLSFTYTRLIPLETLSCSAISYCLLPKDYHIVPSGEIVLSPNDPNYRIDSPKVYFNGLNMYVLQSPIAEKTYSIQNTPGGSLIAPQTGKIQYEYSSLRTDSFTDESMIFIDIKDIIIDQLLKKIENRGVILFLNSLLPTRITFYSANTNTVFKPALSISWKTTSRSLLPSGFSYIEKTPGYDEDIVISVPEKVYVNEIKTFFLNIVIRRVGELKYERNYIGYRGFVERKIPIELKVSIIRKDNPGFIVLNDDVVEFPFIENPQFSEKEKVTGRFMVSFNDFPLGHYQFAFKLYYPSGEKTIIYSNPFEVTE